MAVDRKTKAVKVSFKYHTFGSAQERDHNGIVRILVGLAKYKH